MIPAPTIANDVERVASLHKMNLLSTAREADLDRIIRVAQRCFGTEIVLVSLVDKDRQWFKARCGLNACETGRDISFCGHAIQFDDALVVLDTHQDQRFFDNPLVTGGPAIRFYAGHPLSNALGFKIGTLCLISAHPRSAFDGGCRQILADMARMAEVVINNRALSEAQNAVLSALDHRDRDQMLDHATSLWTRDGFELFLARELGYIAKSQAMIGMAVIEIAATPSDGLLAIVAEHLTQMLRLVDIVARFGEAQFAVILPKASHSLLQDVGAKLIDFFARSSALAEFSLEPRCVSVGMVLAGGAKAASLTPRDLIDASLAVVDHVRNSGGGRCEIITLA